MTDPPTVAPGGATTPPATLARARKLGWVLLGAAAVVLVVLAIRGVADGSPHASGTGMRAPAFVLPLLDGADGSSVNAHDLAGRATVINVWASWCPPCREEAPALRRAHENADPERVTFLSVVRNDSEHSARDFIERFDLAFPQVIDDGSFARAYGVRGIPMTFVIDPSGHVSARHFGPISESRLAVLIEDALTRSAASATARRP